MAIAKVEVKRDICIGASPCVVAAPSVFELDAENKAVIIKKEGEKSSDSSEKSVLEDAEISDDSLMTAAQSCPVKAIFLYDEEGNQIYPEA